ncbi:MAG: RNA-guided endonuclease InsQ/TnpB family protein [Hassallia sp.]
MTRPRFFGYLACKLKLLQQRVSKKKLGSNNWRKAVQKVSRLYEHIHNVRKDFHFKLAHHLCEQAGTIFAEDLNLKAMSCGMLCKHTLDAGFGEFLSILAWVCWKRGVFFLKVNPNGTSQICPHCQTVIGRKELSERVHKCRHCGYQTDRDVAAAQVVRQRRLAAVGSTGLACLVFALRVSPWERARSLDSR